MAELEESEAEHSEANESPTEHSLGESSGTDKKEHESFSLEVLWVRGKWKQAASLDRNTKMSIMLPYYSS